MRIGFGAFKQSLRQSATADIAGAHREECKDGQPAQLGDVEGEGPQVLREDDQENDCWHLQGWKPYRARTCLSMKASLRSERDRNGRHVTAARAVLSRNLHAATAKQKTRKLRNALQSRHKSRHRL